MNRNITSLCCTPGTNRVLYVSQLWNASFVVVFAYCNIVLGFPVSSPSKEFACNVGDLGSIPWLGRSPGGGHGNPLQYSCLENLHELRSLEGYSPKGRKELHMTEWLSTQHYIRHRMHPQFYWISAAVVLNLSVPFFPIIICLFMVINTF